MEESKVRLLAVEKLICQIEDGKVADLSPVTQWTLLESHSWQCRLRLPPRQTSYPHGTVVYPLVGMIQY